MSSTQFFVLSALIERGPMHGHALRQLAEVERVSLWTDISVGGLYAALKRMATAGTIEVVRTEQDGNYPPRQIYAVTLDGRRALEQQRVETARTVAFPTDPFDLVFARGGVKDEQVLRQTLNERIETYRTQVSHLQDRLRTIERHLWLGEKLGIEHRIARLEAEIRWHEDTVAKAADIVADEQVRQQHKGEKS